MKTPTGLQPLIDDGMVDTVVRRLKSGKEASVYIVACGDQVRCAKVYKEAQHRGFHRLAQYTEGRKMRNSRDQRAMSKRGRHGRRVQEVEWKNAEVDALYLLAGVGVRVPMPYLVHEGVLLMELVCDAEGHPAPRLNDVEISAAQAREWHAFMISQIVRMLCAGLIHGDLSDFNVLLSKGGPVIIDLPQAVHAASNNNAFAMLERDVNNMRTAFGRSAPELLDTEYAREIWKLFETGELTPNAALSGYCAPDTTAADVDAVLNHIEEERQEAELRERRRLEVDAA
ncbi:MAG TPA: PA4780 family RIO1-like protein kinase [Steroidobacteraceae bacterium]|nr:PA4780 family RIO1-like protein kinase [Steroidobacteraceae bacterium]